MAKTKDPLGSGGEGSGESRISEFTGDRPSRIKTEIEQTRASMDRIIDALGAQLNQFNPRSLLDDMTAFFRSDDLKSDVRRFAAGAARQALKAIKEHPVPSALAGAGIAYLAFFEESEKKKTWKRREAELAETGVSRYEAGRARPEYTEVEEAALRGPTEEPGEAARAGAASYGRAEAPETSVRQESRGEPGIMRRARDRMSGMAESVQGAAGGVSEKMKGAASSTGGTMKSTASTATEKTRGTASMAAGKMKGAAAATVHGIREMASSMAHKMGQVTGRASSGTGKMGGRAGPKAREVGQSLRGRATEAGHMARARATDVGHQLRRGYDYGRNRAMEVADEHPLAVSAALAGLGILIGLALPRTRSEDRLVGSKADHLKRRAKTTGREMVERGMHIAQTTAEETIDEARRQGLTPSAIADKAKQAASELKGAASDVAQREQLTPGALTDKAKAVAEHARETAQQEMGQPQEQPKNLQETKV